MRLRIVQLLLPLLLLAQVGLGMSPGRMLCIASRCCGHDAVQLSHHEHAHGCGHAHEQGHEHDHDRAHTHGAAVTVLDACDGADCHFHIAMPDDAGTSRDRSADHFFDLRLLQIARLDEPACGAASRGSRPVEAPPPWCFASCDQACARESMRLLI